MSAAVSIPSPSTLDLLSKAEISEIDARIDEMLRLNRRIIGLYRAAYRALAMARVYKTEKAYDFRGRALGADERIVDCVEQINSYRAQIKKHRTELRERSAR